MRILLHLLTFFYNICTTGDSFLSNRKGRLVMKSTCVNEVVTQGRSYLDSNISIQDCFFSRTVGYNAYGGVIMVTQNSLVLSISNVVFYNCEVSNSNYGGAIYFSSLNSNLKMVCAYRCKGYYYHFALLETLENNNVEYLSMSLCCYSKSTFYSIALVNGYQKFDNSNCSFNYAAECSGLSIFQQKSLSSSFCNMYSNDVSGFICMHLFCNPGSLSRANIIRNSSPSKGVVYGTGNTGTFTLNECIFSSNQNTLFFVLSDRTLIISNCNINHAYLLNSGNIQTSGSSLTSTNSFKFEFYSTKYCLAENPYVGFKHTSQSIYTKKTPVQVIFLCLLF